MKISDISHDERLYLRSVALSLLLGIFLLTTSTVSANESKLISGFHSENKVFRVYADGKIEQAFPPPQLPTHGNWSKVAQVVISPQQQKIAYIQDKDLWMYDMTRKEALRVTSVGKPYSKEWASVEVSIKLWSMDEGRILYSVASGETMDPEGYEAEKKIRPEQYGLFVHDFSSGRNTGIILPKGSGEPVAWLNNGDILLHRKNRLAHYGLAKGGITNELYVDQFKAIGQIVISHNGKQMLATANLVGKDQSSTLINMDLNNTRKITYLTKKGKWAEYQRPTFSPDDTRIAYLHRTGQSAQKYPVADLVVDDKAIYSYEGYARLEWINNTAIALLVALGKQRELVVLDANSGTLKAKHRLE